MKRWNGWGDEKTDYPLPDSAATYLSNLIGPGKPSPDAPFDTVVASVPDSRLPSHRLTSVDPVQRLCHARGQSLPDWIALRSGRIGVFPDGVAYPASNDDVRDLLRYGRETGARLIPYGGGTSVVGHINPLPADRPTLTIDLGRFDQLSHLDESSRLATFGAGVTGPELEAQLRPLGYTLGHFPQSFEYSTLGGWIATRSSGQQSYYYGRIEALFAGAHAESPLGTLKISPLPASAAGPDLRHFLLGSEGRFGIITQATVRVRPLPTVDDFYAIVFRDWESGLEAVRETAQVRVGLSMLRLSDAQESETTLALAGREQQVKWADRGLRFLNFGPGRCLLLYGVTGNRKRTSQARKQVVAIARSHGGLPLGRTVGDIWRKSRFLAPYLRNTLWDRGYAIDTLETAVPWSSVQGTAAALKASIQKGLEQIGERVLVFAHLSHVYVDGASIYVTYVFRRTADPDETHDRWLGLKEAASEVIVEKGGTISHQHGVGLDHAPYLKAEKGVVGMAWLEAVRRATDPEGLMNPGKLLAESTGN